MIYKPDNPSCCWPRSNPESLWTTPGLNLTVAALQCQVIYLLHHFRISLSTALCQAPVEPTGHLRPDMTAKILAQKTKVMPERIKASEKSPSTCSTLLPHVFSQAVSGGAELTWGDGRKRGRECQRRKVKSLLAYRCDDMTCSVS